MSTLYEHIEKLGKDKGFKNMTTLCKEAGVPRATMTELKMGRSKDLSKPNAQKFADALGVPLGTIYGTETEKPAEAQGGLGELSEEELDYIRWFRERATEKEKEIVRLIVNGKPGGQ